MKRRPILVAVAVVAAAGTAFWVRGGGPSGQPSKSDPIEAVRREQAAALERDAESVRRLNAERRPPEALPRAVDLPAVSPEQKERIRGAHEKKERARLAFEELLAKQAAERAAAAPPANSAPAEESAKKPKLTLRVESVPGPLLALRAVPLRITLANEGDAELVLLHPPAPTLGSFHLSLRAPGGAWRRVALFLDTGGQPSLETRTPLQPGARTVVHAEPTLGLGYDGGRFVAGRWGLRVEHGSDTEPRMPRPEAEIEIQVVEPQGADRAFLQGLIDEKRLGWLGARANVTAAEGADVWRELAQRVRSQGMAAYAQDLRAGLLALAKAGRSGFPSEERSARIRELAEGLEAPSSWPRAERLLLTAWAAEQAGDSAKAADLRAAFARLCPNDVRVGR